MPKVVKTTDVPADPKRLYIYLYCDKLGCYKSTTKKKAAKSWLSLSESKRRRFLKTCRLRKDLNDTQRVLSTEPFLKPLYNSTVDDNGGKNIIDGKQNDLCLEGDNEVQNETCLNNDNMEENEIYLHEQQINKTCLNEKNEEQNETCYGDKEVQNKTCLDRQNGEQSETCLDGDNELQNKTCKDNDNRKRNEICLNKQQQNKTSLDDDSEMQNDTCLENNNGDADESHLVDDDESCNSDKNQKRDIPRHLDVNSICKEINGSDTESITNTEEQTNQGTNRDEINPINSKSGFINNIREPIPPTVKNWKELYVLLNKDKNIRLQDLNVSDIDRQTHQVLFRKIRQQYIENYIKYLESLSDKQLYEHYLKET